MEVRKGYKQAEFGIIPEEWIECRFEDVMTGFSSGQTPYRAVESYYRGDIPWITSGELNYNVITDTIEKITIEGVREANLKMIPKGTFLFAITGLEAAGTRGSCAITGLEATTNQSCMALYPNKNVLITPYLYHYYIRYGNELAFRYCQGTKQQSYTGGIVKQLPIIVPNKIEEQTAIATALSDADALITRLEKLIEKKRAIKQGAMQELLRPKEGWEIFKLNEISSITRLAGYEYSTVWEESVNGEIIALRGFNIGKNKIIDRDFVRISNELSMRLKRSRLFKGDVVYPCVGTIGNAAVIEENDMYHIQQNIAKITPNKNILDSWFLAHYLMSDLGLKEIEKFNGSSSQPNILVGSLREYSIQLPSKLEQTRIATILSDMDAEITALEQKLAKYKQIKQGMMQELLTGRIRLVENV